MKTSTLPFEPRDREGLRRLWELIQRHRTEVERATLQAVQHVPTFAAVLASMPPEALAVEQRAGEERQRAALVEGKWEPYLENLRAQGGTYARLGIDFRDWYAILGAYREVLLDRILPPDRELRELVSALDRFSELGMSELAAAYIETKEALIRQAEAQLELYVDTFRDASLGMAILHWGAPPDLETFRFVAANPAAARLVGWRVDPSLRPSRASLATFARAIETRAPQEWSFMEDRSPGRSFEARCFPLRDGHVGVILEDVSERKRMQDRVQRHVLELARSNRELDDFAYVASHDLKAPLQDVRNLAEWIAEDAGSRLEPASLRHVELLRERVRRMETLLDDLLDYSRVGRVEDASQELSLVDAFDAAVALVAAREGFRIELDAPPITLVTPRAPFEKVLRNLVANALKHHDREEGSVVVRARIEGDRAIFEVADDGPGIPREFHERVFRMFQTLKPRDEVEGSGVGLAIVKKAVELHGGTVVVESEGRGTTIRYTWPLRWPEEAP
jgi:signal transduction histidine kinase